MCRQQVYCKWNIEFR